MCTPTSRFTCSTTHTCQTLSLTKAAMCSLQTPHRHLSVQHSASALKGAHCIHHPCHSAACSLQIATLTAVRLLSPLHLDMYFCSCSSSTPSGTHMRPHMHGTLRHGCYSVHTCIDSGSGQPCHFKVRLPRFHCFRSLELRILSSARTSQLPRARLTCATFTYCCPLNM